MEKKGKMATKATASNVPRNVSYQTLFYALQTYLCTFQETLSVQVFIQTALALT